MIGKLNLKTIGFKSDNIKRGKDKIIDKINELIDYINLKEIEVPATCVHNLYSNKCCDKCSPNKEENQDWEKEFEKWAEGLRSKKGQELCNPEAPIKYLKTFISQELQSCKEQTKKEIIEKIEKTTKGFKTSRFADVKKTIYVDDILSIIKEE